MVYLKDCNGLITVTTSYGWEHEVPNVGLINIDNKLSVPYLTFLDLKEEFGDRDISIEEIKDFLMILEL